MTKAKIGNDHGYFDEKTGKCVTPAGIHDVDVHARLS